MLNCLTTVSNLGIFNHQRSSNSFRFLCKIWFENGTEMARISAIFLRHCHRAIIFYFSATATFFSSRQWRGGAKSGANAEHCVSASSRTCHLLQLLMSADGSHIPCWTAMCTQFTPRGTALSGPFCWLRCLFPSRVQIFLEYFRHVVDLSSRRLVEGGGSSSLNSWWTYIQRGSISGRGGGS